MVGKAWFLVKFCIGLIVSPLKAAVGEVIGLLNLPAGLHSGPGRQSFHPVDTGPALLGALEPYLSDDDRKIKVFAGQRMVKINRHVAAVQSDTPERLDIGPEYSGNPLQQPFGIKATQTRFGNRLLSEVIRLISFIAKSERSDAKSRQLAGLLDVIYYF